MTGVWRAVHRELLDRGPGVRLSLPKGEVEHPRGAGARLSAGLPVLHRGERQRADYRFPPDHGCRGLHAQEYSREWVVHVDQVHPDCDLIDHLRKDAPHAWHFSGAAVGGLIGAALGRSAGASLAGAGIGLLLAASLRRPDGD